METIAMPDKLDPRILRTRRMIIQAFFDLLAEKSIDKMSVKDIAEKAQINRATFYYHFRDKDALLTFALEDQLMTHVLKPFETMETVDQRALKHVLHTLLSVKSYLSDRCAENEQTFYDQIEQAIKARLTDAFVDVLRAKNEPEKVVRIEATMLSWALYGAMEVIHEREENEKNDMINQVVNRLSINR